MYRNLQRAVSYPLATPCASQLHIGFPILCYQHRSQLSFHTKGYKRIENTQLRCCLSRSCQFLYNKLLYKLVSRICFFPTTDSKIRRAY